MSRDSEEAFGDPTGSIRKVLQDANPQIFPKALAARIGERDIWIADRGGVEPANLAAMDLDPKFVISVNQQATEATTDHHPLKEGYMNDQQEFKQAVETTGNRLQQSGLVIVNCAAGISRSTAVSATAIAANEGCSFDTVVEEIKETRSRAHPHPKLRLNALAYLVNNEDRAEARTRFEELAKDTRMGRSNDTTPAELLSSLAN